MAKLKTNEIEATSDATVKFTSSVQVGEDAGVKHLVVKGTSELKGNVDCLGDLDVVGAGKVAKFTEIDAVSGDFESLTVDGDAVSTTVGLVPKWYVVAGFAVAWAYRYYQSGNWNDGGNWWKWYQWTGGADDAILYRQSGFTGTGASIIAVDSDGTSPANGGDRGGLRFTFNTDAGPGDTDYVVTINGVIVSDDAEPGLSVVFTDLLSTHPEIVSGAVPSGGDAGPITKMNLGCRRSATYFDIYMEDGGRLRQEDAWRFGNPYDGATNVYITDLYIPMRIEVYEI